LYGRKKNVSKGMDREREKDRNMMGGVFGKRTKKGGRGSIRNTNEYFKIRIRRREMK